MSTREQLAEVIRDRVGVWRTPLEAADAIIAAGWTKEADEPTHDGWDRIHFEQTGCDGSLHTTGDCLAASND